MELFFSLPLLLEELLEQAAQCPALLRDHLLQQRIRPEATVSSCGVPTMQPGTAWEPH